MSRFLLMHSPLLGPSSWARTASALARAGHVAEVPDLRAFTAATDPTAAFRLEVHRAARQVDTACWVVAHSGAGAVVPIAASATADCAGAIFVDAVIPPETGSFVVNERFRKFLTGLSTDVYLPKWTTWWPDEIKRLVPDPDLRAELESDAPAVPVRFYDSPIDIPGSWNPAVVAYVQLSSAYDEERIEADRRGWKTFVVASNHLATLNDPENVAALLTGITNS